MAYEHDIFISYRRDPETCSWIKEHFVPLLRLRVGLELERKPTIFVDDQIESGTSWPASLGRALGASRILIPLWTGNYLSSVWCTEELSHMLAREREAKLRTAKRPGGLIVPAVIHDGNEFPPPLEEVEHFEIQYSFNPRMAHNSARAEELDAALKAQALAIVKCIGNAPAWRKAWPEKAVRQFFKKLHRKDEPIQKKVPGFTSH